VLVCPTVPLRRLRLGKTADPLSMYLTDLMTITVNLAGLGLSLPCGFDNNNLPIGLQLIGNVLKISCFKLLMLMSNRLSGINAP